MSKKYIGNELNYFSKAINWKKYFSNLIYPYLGDKVLEVGAGIGSNIPHLNRSKNKKWHCLEPDTEFCKKIEMAFLGDYPNIIIKNGTLSSINEQFNSILYIDVIEHIKNDKSEIYDATKLLFNNGYLIILVPAHQYLFNEFDSHVGHYRRYNMKKINQLIPCNIELTSCKYLDSIGLIASIFNKFLLRQSLPTVKQIKFWDNYLVPASKILDQSLNYNIGKSILLIGKKVA